MQSCQKCVGGGCETKMLLPNWCYCGTVSVCFGGLSWFGVGKLVSLYRSLFGSGPLHLAVGKPFFPI